MSSGSDPRKNQQAKLHRARRLLAEHLITGDPLDGCEADEIIDAGLVPLTDMAATLDLHGPAAEYIGDTWTAEADDDGQPRLIWRGGRS